MLFLGAGKPVLCEKPLTLTLKETQRVIAFAKEKNLFLMEGIWSRFFPIYQRIKCDIHEYLGEVSCIRASLGCKNKLMKRLTQKNLGGGATLDVGIYGIQFANFVFGGTPEKILAAGHLNSEGMKIII